MVGGDVVVKLSGLPNVRGAYGGVGHNLLLVLEPVADVAVLVALWADLTVVLLILVAEIRVPLVVVGLPRDVAGQKTSPMLAWVVPGKANGVLWEL